MKYYNSIIILIPILGMPLWLCGLFWGIMFNYNMEVWIKIGFWLLVISSPGLYNLLQLHNYNIPTSENRNRNDKQENS